MSNQPQAPHPTAAAIIVALVVGTLGAAVLVMLPGLLAQLAQQFQLSESELGFVSFADLGGLTLGSAFGATLLVRVGIRTGTRLGLAIAAIANAASAVVTGYLPLLTMRIAAGVGAGIVVAVCYIVLGRSKHVDRNFSIYLLCQGLLGAAALQTLPHLPRALSGAGVFAMLAALIMAAIFLTRRLPAEAYARRDDMDSSRASIVAWIALGAVFAFFMAQGAVWAYLQLIGVNGGLSEAAVGRSLALSTLVGLSGPLIAAAIGSRFGQAMPLLAGLCMALVALGMFGGPIDETRFSIAACLFNVAWNFSVPYQLAALADADGKGHVVGWAATASLAGLSIGPPIAGISIGVDDYTSVLWLSGALCVLSLGAFMPTLSMNAPRRAANG